jgi:hypothetical protein
MVYDFHDSAIPDISERLINEPLKRRTRAASNGWDAPVPLNAVTASLPRFPVDAFPEWLACFVSCVAEETQVPADLPGPLVLAALAAAAGGRAVVQPRPGWTEPTNLFIAPALAPGNRKSAVFRRVTEPLRAAERTEAENAKGAIIEARTQRDIAEQRADAAKRAAARAALDHEPDASTKAEEAKQAALMAEAITVPSMPRLLADDSTPEALVSLMATQGGRVAVLSAEGGIFDIISGKYGKFPSFDVYLKGHAGDELRIDRKGRDAEFIDHPALTVGITIQPAVLRAIAEREGFRGRGLLARFLFSLPTSFVGQRKIGAPATPPEVIERYDADMTALVLSLAEWTDPAVLTFTPEAAALLIEFERDLEPHLGPGGDLHHLADWGSKLAGAVVRIAGLLHLATNLRTGWREPVDATTLTNAARIGTYFRAHAVAVFAHMGANPVIGEAQAILGWIADDPDRTSFTRRDAHRALAARFAKAADLDAPLALLEDHGWIRQHAAPLSRPEGGRPPSPRYEVHPDTHQ